MSKQCAFDGCNKPHLAKGLCRGHYIQQWRGQQLRPLFQPRLRCEAGDGLGWSCIRRHDANGLCTSHNHHRNTSKPFAPIYVVTDATARGVMHAANFQPDGPYPGAHEPWPGVCLKCGQPCSPRYNSVQQGDGPCQSCAEYGIDLNKPTAFYTVAGGGWLKCGITNTLDRRLREHYNQGLTDVLRVLHFKRGHDADALEKLWKEQLKTIPTFARPTKAELPDGYKEACRDVPMVRRWIEKHLVSLAETNISA